MVAGSKPQLTIIHGQVYDISRFMDEHPGGRALLSMAVGRDSTIMYESYHMRSEVVDRVLRERVPKMSISPEKVRTVDPNFDALPATDNIFVETYPTPSQSPLFQSIKKRVREEILKPRGMQQGRGGIGVMREACCVLITWLTAVILYIRNPSIYTGAFLGLAGAWIGFGVQHTANHGGLTPWRKVNAFLGWLDDIALGGSSLVWRYHHHVSHHVYTNDVAKDQDVYSSFPLLRLDQSQQLEWYHAFQWLYAPLIFGGLYFSVQMQDIGAFLEQKIFYVHFNGTTTCESIEFIIGKMLHWCLFLLLPCYIHGWSATWPAFLSFAYFGGFTLTWFFIVSHNVLDAKPDTVSKAAHEDWGIWQIETSATWGGRLSGFFTGGLNYQIEHHLFPGTAHDLYGPIQTIVQEECEKMNVPYHGYGNLFSITVAMLKFMHYMGSKASVKKTD